MVPNSQEESRKERIARMLAEGLLTPSQAEILRDSLGEVPPDTPGVRPERLRWIVWLPGILAVVLLFGYLLFGAGGGEGTIQDVSQTINQPGGTGKMNKPLSNFLAISLILIVPLLIWAWLHNSIVAKEESVYSAWAQVESSYQRRSDLIPALVETVSRFLKHESETFAGVTRERSQDAKAFSSLVDQLAEAQKAAVDLLKKHGGKVIDDDEALRALSRSQSQLGGSMQRIFGLVENYPDLKSSDHFLELQGQLEGTENRINVARMRFNESVQEYNRSIRALPGSMIAGVGNFSRKAYFEADEGTQNAPDLQFD